MLEDIDEQILTAYALGELDGAERAEVEARLGGDDVARRQVEEIRRRSGSVPSLAARRRRG